MFGVLAVTYLFLGGAGAGAIAIASLADLARVRVPFGIAARTSLDEARPAERMVAFGIAGGLAAAAFGTLCLMFDLGRLDRVDAFLSSAEPTILTVGAYALAALLVCSAFLAIVHFAYVPMVPRRAVALVEGAAAVLGLVVMLYAGLLLQSLNGVALWRSPLLPVLFVLSSLSCGCAILLLGARFTGPADANGMRLMRAFVHVDLVVIVLETLCVAVFVGLALASDHPAAAASADSLVSGEHAALWWVGFALCGLAVPLVLEVLAVRATPSNARTMLVLAAVLVLVGGFCLRASIVDAGGHRALELQDVPSASALRLE